MGPALEELPMAPEKPERSKVEMAKIESDVLSRARLIVAMERNLKGRSKARTLSTLLSEILRPNIDKEYARLKKQLDDN